MLLQSVSHHCYLNLLGVVGSVCYFVFVCVFVYLFVVAMCVSRWWMSSVCTRAPVVRSS